MNNHECLLGSNNRGQDSVSALERFQFCMAFPPIYHRMSLVSYKVEKKAPWKALNLIVKKKKKTKREMQGKLFIIMISFFFFFSPVLFGVWFGFKLVR